MPIPDLLASLALILAASLATRALAERLQTLAANLRTRVIAVVSCACRAKWAHAQVRNAVWVEWFADSGCRGCGKIVQIQLCGDFARLAG